MDVGATVEGINHLCLHEESNAEGTIMSRTSASQESTVPLRLGDSDLARDIMFLMARARARGSHHAHDQLARFDLRTRSYSVLALACSDEDPSQRELAEFLRLDPSQIVSLVDDLESRGLVVREADPRDRRSKIITATPAGRQLYSKAAIVAKRAEDEALQPLSSDERDILRELLRRVAF